MPEMLSTIIANKEAHDEIDSSNVLQTEWTSNSSERNFFVKPHLSQSCPSRSKFLDSDDHPLRWLSSARNQISGGPLPRREIRPGRLHQTLHSGAGSLHS